MEAKETNINQDLDIALLARIKQQDTNAMNELLDKYKWLVREKARNLFIQGADYEDLLQEGMIGLFFSVKTYDASKQSSFRHFAALCIYNQMIDAVRKAARQKHKILNDSFSLEYEKQNNEEQWVKIDFLLSEQLGDNPEVEYLSKEKKEMVFTYLNKTLSVLEKKVLNCYLQQMNYEMIAETLKISVKSVNNALQRVRHKIKKGLPYENN